jgi:hypothetical protein
MRPAALVRFALIGLLPLLLFERSAIGAGPAEPEIQRSIKRAADFLRQQRSEAANGENALRAYALMRAGEPPDSPVVAPIIQRIVEKCASSYDPRSLHIYTAAVEVMALEAAGASLYQPQIQTIADYLISKQNSNGSWDYVDRNRTAGDTSQTQYALLGLWAASRAGIDIPGAVWDGAARWHLATQLADGGWTYHPDENRDSRHTMTVAGVGSLHVCRMHLTGAADRDPPVRMFQPTRKFGILEPVAIGAAPQPATSTVNVPEDRPRASRTEIDSRVQRGLGWLTKNYRLKLTAWPMYYLYGIERMAALGEITAIGEHDWYAEGAAMLIAEQKTDGTWQGNGGPVPSTAFGILFLSRATAKSLDRKKRPSPLGGGLLAGGRGLPENLNEVQVDDGKVASRRPTGPIDELLAELERPETLKIEVVQTAIVEQIQLGDREELIGQKERLKTLAADPRIDVRRTAVWALGHTGDLRIAPLLIEALRDGSVDVNVEAHNALCTLSRDPAGLGLPSDPLAGLPEDAAEEQRNAALAKWREQAYRKWRDWYLTVRPYDERDDLTRLRIAR